MWPDRIRAALLLALVIAQAALGWVVHVEPGFLPYHLLLGITVLLPVAMHVGLRAAFDADTAARSRALAVGLLVVLQLAVGGFAWLVPRRLGFGAWTGPVDRALVAAHWVVGAATVVAAVAWLAATFSDPRAAAGPIVEPQREPRARP